MKKVWTAGAFVLAMAIGSTAAAQEVAVGTTPTDGAAFNPFVVGAYMSMGMGMVVGDPDEAKPRFAGGGGAYFDFYLMPILAVEGGVGFVGKGYRTKEDEAGIGEIKSWTKFVYMEIPLGVKLNIKGFQAGVAVALSFALSGKIKAEVDGHESSSSFSGDDWDNVSRFNLGPKITLGYAIPIGPVALVPGLSWSMHLLNDVKGDLADDSSSRAMNLMINVGAEFGFGG